MRYKTVNERLVHHLRHLFTAAVYQVSYEAKGFVHYFLTLANSYLAGRVLASDQRLQILHYLFRLPHQHLLVLRLRHAVHYRSKRLQ